MSWEEIGFTTYFGKKEKLEHAYELLLKSRNEMHEALDKVKTALWWIENLIQDEQDKVWEK